MDSQPTLVRFSLSEVPERERDVTLRETFGRAVLNMDFTPLTADPDFNLECQILPGAVITRNWNTPHALTSGYDRSLDNDDLAVVWGSSDGGVIRQNGKEALSNRGPVLISCAEPTSAYTGKNVVSLTVRLQRSLLLSMLPRAESLMMQQSIGPDNEALRLLTGYHSLLCARQLSDPELGHVAAVHICDLVALMFGTAGARHHVARNRGLRAARFRSIKHWVMTHLLDPSLCIATAAAAQGLSPRYVQMLFAEADSTFSEFVLRRRLQFVHRSLRNHELGARPISSIVYDSGFSDLSYFNRAFKAAYGESPSDVRARTQAQPEISSL